MDEKISKPLRVAVYCRVNHVSQFGELEHQQKIVERFCEANNMKRIATWSDEVSGGIMNRPGFQEMKQFLETGSVDGLVVYDISRISRDVSDYMDFEKQMNELGLDIYSVTKGGILKLNETKLSVAYESLKNAKER